MEDDHGKKASLFLKMWLSAFGLEKDKEWKLVLDAITNHSDKVNAEKSRNNYYKVLADADVLDKVTIDYVMSAHKLFYNNYELNNIRNKFINKVIQYKGCTTLYNEVLIELVTELKK